MVLEMRLQEPHLIIDYLRPLRLHRLFAFWLEIATCALHSDRPVESLFERLFASPDHRQPSFIHAHRNAKGQPSEGGQMRLVEDTRGRNAITIRPRPIMGQASSLTFYKFASPAL